MSAAAALFDIRMSGSTRASAASAGSSEGKTLSVTAITGRGMGDLFLLSIRWARLSKLEHILVCLIGDCPPPIVTPGLDPGVHLLRMKFVRRRWIAGSSPAMTAEYCAEPTSTCA